MSKMYLSYGSNLSVEQMLRRCPGAVYIGTAELKGWKLMFRGSKTGSYLTIEKAKRGKVPLVVWKVDDQDEDALDSYEGAPIFYRKETMEVEVLSLLDGSPIGAVEAFIYIMNGERPKGQPSDFYYLTCEEGYERFGFDKKILEKAYRESKETR